MGKKKTSWKSVGNTLTYKEVGQLAKASGKDPLKIIANATGRGVSLGPKVVNEYNKGAYGSATYGTKTADKLAPLTGLKLEKGTAYSGYSTSTTPGVMPTRQNNYIPKPGTTTYNPIITNLKIRRGAGGSTAGGGKTKGKDDTSRSGNPLASQGREMGLSGRELADYVKSQARQANGYVAPSAGGSLAAGMDTSNSESGSPTSYADALDSYEGMTGGGSGLSGAMGLRRAFSRWRSQNRSTQGTNNFRRFLQIGAPNINLN